KLASAAETLARAALTFEDTNRALVGLKDFSADLESAAGQITEAVAALPTQMETSLATMSEDVAQGINSGLQNQSEYLRGLVAIYSEHAVALSKIVEFISQLNADHKAACDVLGKLSSLPMELQAIASNVAQSTSASNTLNTSVQALDA